LRREAVEKLDDILKKKNKRQPIDEKLYRDKKKDFFAYKANNRDIDNRISIRVSNIEQFEQLDLDKLDRIYLGFYDNLDEVIDKINKHQKEIYIWTDKILYQRDLDQIGEK